MSENKYQIIGEDEEKRWLEVHEAVKEELKKSKKDWEQDKALARELTSQIVATRRDEEKSALASDEAVAHGLSKLRQEKTSGLDSLLEQAYFARVITSENGKNIEFRLGTASLPSQRIIDWRKAPISKLYYDYEEGEEFCEDIQGREREGLIKLRRAYQGIQDKLNIIETKEGKIVKTDNKWTLEDNDPLSRNIGQDGHLPPILSLITADQFELITHNATDPLIIQGIAGSGKTTVALHRLAWLLHEENSDARPENCLVVMLNKALKAYVERTLPELKVDGVPIKTYHQWAFHLLEGLVGHFPYQEFEESEELILFKSSKEALDLIQSYHKKYGSSELSNIVDDYLIFLSECLEKDLPSEKPDQIKSEIEKQLRTESIGPSDLGLILLLIYENFGSYPSIKAGVSANLDHLVIDEAQDFGFVEIKSLCNALNEGKTVTLVGDLAQKIDMSRGFDSWEKILNEAGLKNTHPIPLTVSHRSTQEILNLASRVRMKSGEAIDLQAKRHGPDPSWIQAENPQIMIHLISRWIDDRLQENRNSFNGILCRRPEEARELVSKLRREGQVMVRWGYEDQFDFSPGVVVTHVADAKGLEFRNVLVVDPSSKNYYSKSRMERNLLYVAITRAEVRLDFIGIDSHSPLLPNLPAHRFENNGTNKNLSTQEARGDESRLFDNPEDL